MTAGGEEKVKRHMGALRRFVRQPLVRICASFLFVIALLVWLAWLLTDISSKRQDVFWILVAGIVAAAVIVIIDMALPPARRQRFEAGLEGIFGLSILGAGAMLFYMGVAIVGMAIKLFSVGTAIKYLDDIIAMTAMFWGWGFSGFSGLGLLMMIQAYFTIKTARRKWREASKLANSPVEDQWPSLQ